MRHIFYVEGESFVDAQATSIQQGEQGAVAHADPIFCAEEVGVFQDFHGLPFEEGARQFVTEFRAAKYAYGGVMHDAVFIHPI